MAHDHSVTNWLDGVRSGEDLDISQLWDRYFQRLVRLAGSRLPGHARRTMDEEDVALSAFHSFCDRARKGQFPDLASRDDLWRVLFAITVRKAVAAVRHQMRQKRGGGQVLGESALDQGDASIAGGLSRFLGKEPSPEDAARFAEQLDALLAKLGDPTLCTIALQRLEGFSSEEIAAGLGLSSRTVTRKLQLVRAKWAEDAE
jgi:DNA-directed RNA polymerase specialized sigma24 family protein